MDVPEHWLGVICWKATSMQGCAPVNGHPWICMDRIPMVSHAVLKGSLREEASLWRHQGGSTEEEASGKKHADHERIHEKDIMEEASWS